MNSKLCKMCGRPPDYHEGLKHPWTAEGTEVDMAFLKTKQEDVLSPTGNTSGPVISSSSLPFDPVLRTALINKGVLTMQDLEEADAFIRAVGGVLNGNQKPE